MSFTYEDTSYPANTRTTTCSDVAFRGSCANDCLVFRIIEKDSSPQGEDTDIFILYDTYNERFLLRGKRSDTSKTAFKPYSLESYYAKPIVDFLRFVIPTENICVFELYSYPNLPRNKDNITFDQLREDMSPQHEIVAYNSNRIIHKEVMRILSILVDVANDYEPELAAETEWESTEWTNA
jgi:hypothetical protein